MPVRGKVSRPGTRLKSHTRYQLSSGTLGTLLPLERVISSLAAYHTLTVLSVAMHVTNSVVAVHVVIGKLVHGLETLKMYIIIASPGKDDGRRRGKLEGWKMEETKRGPPSPILASSPNHKFNSDKRSRRILG